jgi:hypothetical protein
MTNLLLFLIFSLFLFTFWLQSKITFNILRINVLPSYNLQIDTFTFLAIYFITLSLNIHMSADLKLKEMHNLAH